MSACGPFESYDLKNEDEQFTNVEYSEDGKSVTIYMDGCAPVPANRALSKSLAILGHDFFEVVFLYNPDDNPAHYVIARGSWELGQPAGVNGIYRTQAGVPYDAAISGAPALGHGTAIMFAGKKTDKTLLAVGAFTDARDSGNTSTGKNISSDTKSVSFALNALKGGAMSGDNAIPSNASVLTDAQSSGYGNNVASNRTEIRNTGIKSRIFPAYVIPITKSGGNNRTRLHYTVDVAANVPGYTPSGANNHFEYYRNGILYADPLSAASPRTVVNIEPKFTEVDSGGVVHVQKADSPFVWFHPSTSPVSFYVGSTNMTEGAVFSNPVRFELNPLGGTDNEIFSFAFQVPVHALSVTKTSASDPDPVTWFIRNGYDKYVEELDDGKNGSGGAILIAIGSVAEPETKWLEITKYPRTQYNPTNGGYNFYVENIELQYHTGNSSAPVAQIPWNHANISYAYSIDGNTWTSIAPGSSALTPPPDNQEYKIRVRYTVSTNPPPGEFYDAFYTILVSTTSVDTGNLLAGNRFVISSPNSWTQFINAIQNSSRQGVYLAVFSTSFNIPQTTLNITGDFTLIITANQPGVVIGRQGTGAINTFTFNGPGNVMVFMGKWPFDEPVMAGGDILIDFPFQVSARDTYQNYPGGTAISGIMCVKGTGAGALSVRAPGITINYPAYVPFIP